MATHPATSTDDGDEYLVVNVSIRIPMAEFELSYTHSSGPGGQNVNKVATKARLRWNVTESPSLRDDVRERFLQKFGSRLTTAGELLLTSQAHRSRSRNAEDCIERLRQMLLEIATPPRRRKPTRRSRGSIERRLGDKRKRSERKQQRRRPSRDD